MTDRTLGIIYALKKSKKPWFLTVAKYMSRETGIPIYEYDEPTLNSIMKNVFVSYVKTCDRPETVVSDLLYNLGNKESSIGSIIANVLINQPVKDSFGNYLNGFRQYKESD